jgi:hypothetical protein
LKLKYQKPLSNFAFNLLQTAFNHVLSRYNQGVNGNSNEWQAGGGGGGTDPASAAAAAAMATAQQLFGFMSAQQQQAGVGGGGGGYPGAGWHHPHASEPNHNPTRPGSAPANAAALGPHHRQALALNGAFHSALNAHLPHEQGGSRARHVTDTRFESFLSHVSELAS